MPLLPVFLLSGVAALLYQLVWQRALFAIYGIDTASVTIVVSAFMLGLGAGSLLGGALSRRLPPLPLFASFELAIGAFGAFSLDLFGAVGRATLGASHLATAALTLGLVLVPTMLMGATLPLLVAHRVAQTRNTGRSVGALYFANTLGAALGCFLAGAFLLRALGMQGAARAAATLNALLGVAVLLFGRRA